MTESSSPAPSDTPSSKQLQAGVDAYIGWKENTGNESSSAFGGNLHDLARRVYEAMSNAATPPSAAPQAPAPSDTPRTDDRVYKGRLSQRGGWYTVKTEWVLADFARRLERELAEAIRDGIERAQSYLRRAEKAERELATLRSAERCDRDAIIEECAKEAEDRVTCIAVGIDRRYWEGRDDAAALIRALKNAAPQGDQGRRSNASPTPAVAAPRSAERYGNDPGP